MRNCTKFDKNFLPNHTENMKSIFRIFAIQAIVLYIADQIAGGLVFEDKLTGILITGAALAVATITVKPIIKILILPLTLATLGLLRFLAYAITLYIVDLALPQFQITGFHFAGFTSQYFDLPAVNFSQGPMAFIAFSLLISIITTLIHWMTK